MKINTKTLVPFALSLLVSACSTSSQQNTESVVLAEPKQNTETVEEPSESSVALQNQNDALIQSLQQQIADNQIQLASLNQSLDEKDATIAALQAASTNADTLRELEAQKQSREELEIQFSALNLDNDLLRYRINELENENRAFEENNTQLERENKSIRAQLEELKQENQALGESLTELRAQHQSLLSQYQTLNNSISTVEEVEQPVIQDAVDKDLEIARLQSLIEEQKTTIAEYQGEIALLKSALSESQDYESRWQELDEKLAEAQQRNRLLSDQINAAESALSASESAPNPLLERLNNLREALNAQENSGILMTAVMDGLQEQMSTRLLDIDWQLPNEMALHNTFEIIVTARAQPSLSGQTYLAELVTDSAIQMISEPVTTAAIESGALQWRWRVSGLNEKPSARLNLIVNQQINFQNQIVMRQVYRGSETLSLINTNLLEKYGYWAGAILLALLGGFVVGRLNNRKKNTL